MKKPTALFPADEQYDLLHDNQWQHYMRRILDVLRICRSLELADNDLIVRVVRHDIADFRRNPRLDLERFAEDMLVDRIRYRTPFSFELECSALKLRHGRATTDAERRHLRLTDLKHTCILRIDRYMVAPCVNVHSIYLLMQLVERSMRLRIGAAEPTDKRPFDEVSQSDTGDQRDFEELSGVYSASIEALR